MEFPKSEDEFWRGEGQRFYADNSDPQPISYRLTNDNIPIMRRLPDKLLDEIFLDAVLQERQPTRTVLLHSEKYAYPSPPKYGFKPRMSKRLSHICRHWRARTICLPQLWRRVEVNAPGKDASKFFSLVLLRSGEQPLSLHLTQTRKEQLGEVDAILQIALRMPYSNRWEGIFLSLLDGQIAEAQFLSQLRDSEVRFESLLDFLTRFEAAFTSTATDSLEAELWELVSTKSPRLRYVCWDIRHPWLHAHNLPLEKALYFEFMQLSVDEALYLLRIAPQVEVVTVHNTYLPLGPFLPSVPVEASKLRGLHISSGGPSRAGDDAYQWPIFMFLSLLTASKLEELGIESDREDIPSTAATFLDRSRCSLNGLFLTSTSASPEWERGVVKLLQCKSASTVTKFRILNKFSPFSKLLPALTNRGDARCLLPKLVELYLFVGASIATNPDGVLGNMVRSRFESEWAVTGLKICTISCGIAPRIISLDMSRLLDVWRGGLELNWLGHGRVIGGG